jgi:hemerythrin superfamily protein
MENSTTVFPSITSMIRLDHTHVLALFRRYKPGTSLARKRAIVANACLALEIHAQLEEEIFYPALRGAGAAEPALEKSVPEHDEMRRLISRLRELEPGSGSYDQTFRELMRAVLHHVADEETILLPQAEERLAGNLGRLGLEMTKRRLELLKPHAGEVITTGARSFPVATAALALGVVLCGVQLFLATGTRRSHRYA